MQKKFRQQQRFCSWGCVLLCVLLGTQLLTAANVRQVNRRLIVEGDPITGETVRIWQDDASNQISVSVMKEQSILVGLRWAFHPFHLKGPYLSPNYITVTLPHVTKYNSDSIDLVSVNLGNGNDSLTLRFDSHVDHGKAYDISLGAGSNKLHLDLPSVDAIDVNDQLTIDVLSGPGRDSFYINQHVAPGSVAPINISAGTMLRLAIEDLGGSDTYNTMLKTAIHGHLDLRLPGQNGADQGSTHIEVLAGSFGSVYYPVASNPLPLTGGIATGSLISRHYAPVAQAPANALRINDEGLTRAEIQALELELRNRDPNGVGIGMLPHEMWYDAVSGAIGLVGWGTAEFGPPNLPLPARVLEIPKDISTRLWNPQAPHDNQLGSGHCVNCRAYCVNCREITVHELGFLLNLLANAPAIQLPPNTSSFYLDNNGDAGVLNLNVDPNTGQIVKTRGPVLVNFVTLAQQQNAGQTRPGPFSTYDLTGISVFADGNGFVDYLDRN